MARRSGHREDDETGFLSRWSERKRGLGQETEASRDVASTDAAPDGEIEAEAAWSEEEVEAKLSEIEGMKQGDDFKPLLKAGIPEVVKRAALRKLWRSNPVFGILDGLNDYDLDYTLKPGVVEQVRSAYQAGKGYVYDEEKEAERQAEIAARQARDKERDEARRRAAAETGAERPATSSSSEASSETPAEYASAAEPAGETAPPSGPESGGEAAPRKPRGSAAARRWGGDPA